MAEILSWKYDYLPLENRWTIVKCKEYQDILNFIRPQSIILISSEEYSLKENYLFFQLIELKFNQCEILFIDKMSERELDEKINNLIRRKYLISDNKSKLKKTFENLMKFCKNE